MRDIVIVSAARTAVGSFGGSLAGTPTVELGKAVVTEVIKRAGLKPENIDRVVMGCVLTAGLGQNVARQIELAAGIPADRTAYTVNMVCGSGLKAVIEGAKCIMLGEAEIVVAGGAENMSRAPYAVNTARYGARMGDAQMTDTMIKDGLWCATNDYHMGMTAENVAEKYGITREQLDEFSVKSQQKAEQAIESGKFKDEIVPVAVKVKKDNIDFAVDEFVRAGTTAEKLAGLRPAFKRDGLVTAGNASGINDGAAAVLLMSADKARELGLSPMAMIKGYGEAGVDPAIMGIGPVKATQKALASAQITVDDLDLIEANEAFAAQSIAVARDLAFDMEKVNVNGGAIAIGHPIGASGARILVTLLYEMQRREAKKGLATLCIGGGMGIALVVERT